MATATTLYLAFMGRDGLQKVAAACVQNTQTLIKLLTQNPAIEFPFGTSVFHEFVVTLNVDVNQLIEAMAEEDMVSGINISQYYPNEVLENALLICVTETKTADDLVFFTETLNKVISELTGGVQE